MIQNVESSILQVIQYIYAAKDAVETDHTLLLRFIAAKPLFAPPCKLVRLEELVVQ